MTQPVAGAARPPRPLRSPAALALLALAGVLLFSLFAALGWWQLERRAWKLQLMERVEQRLHTAPTPLPPPAQWPGMDAARSEYQPVQLQGRWLADKTVLTQASTELGAGFWVLTPLQLDGGSQVLVNRGFIPQQLRAGWPQRDPIAQARGAAGAPAQLTGLIRMSEPGGGFLRRNAPAEGRWHSRDVAAIALAQGLSEAAPFFVDAGIPAAAPAGAPQGLRGSEAGPWPRPGLTVVRFHNSHLVYVLTWWGLALLVLGAAAVVTRHEQCLRQGA